MIKLNVILITFNYQFAKICNGPISIFCTKNTVASSS